MLTRTKDDPYPAFGPRPRIPAALVNTDILSRLIWICSYPVNYQRLIYSLISKSQRLLSWRSGSLRTR